MTLQTFSFGKSYVVYGGIFIVMALIWAWKIDNFKPDKYDATAICCTLEDKINNLIRFNKNNILNVEQLKS